MDVAIAIDAEAVNVTHRMVAVAGGGYQPSTGKYVPNAPVGATIRMAIQPAGGQVSGSARSINGNALLDLPEGIRTEAQWLGWTRNVVAVNDEIVHDGVAYRVLFAWPRRTKDAFTRVALGRLTP